MIGCLVFPRRSGPRFITVAEPPAASDSSSPHFTAWHRDRSKRANQQLVSICTDALHEVVKTFETCRASLRSTVSTTSVVVHGSLKLGKQQRRHELQFYAIVESSTTKGMYLKRLQ